MNTDSVQAPFEGECRTHVGNGNGTTFSAEERKRWEAWCRELVEERDRLRAEVALLRKERDAHADAVQALLPAPKYAFTKEEIFAQINDHPSFTELVADVCRMEG